MLFTPRADSSKRKASRAHRSLSRGRSLSLSNSKCRCQGKSSLFGGNTKNQKHQKETECARCISKDTKTILHFLVATRLKDEEKTPSTSPTSENNFNLSLRHLSIGSRTASSCEDKSSFFDEVSPSIFQPGDNFDDDDDEEVSVVNLDEDEPL